MEKLETLTGRGATRVMLSVLEGMRRGVKDGQERGQGQARGCRPGKEGKPSHTIM